ncbi:hypothetical protein BDP27DRAFT_1374971 [Rhodocollybia butyracea]|uniref:Helicase C-terminal domain-containing protein n=1 Tax=Rhodocollybia butyracea TaxID=206335 RepID=A0A9P5TWA2_9AGAR|nr:hypothetical protein BDP27DRAFT_1374971 [Rhodocollybia butyracea]
MPSHTVASALIKLYFTDPSASPIGHPWGWPVWQDITGKEKKIKFAVNSKGASEFPGHKKWATYVTKRWESWKVHATIVQCLHQAGIHPVTILLNEGNIDAEWPSAEMYLPPALESIALSLFGPEAYGDDRNPQLLLPLALRRPLNAIVIRSWDRIRRHIIRDKGRIIEIEKAALKAFDALSQGKPTKTKITATIRAVGKWKDIAELYSTRENLEKAEKMLNQVNNIMSAIEKANVNVNLIEFKSLATPEDLKELVQVYNQYFRTYDDENSQPIGRDFSLQLLDLEVADLGMEFEANLNVMDLAQRLGFQKDNLPLQFNCFRNIAGFTPWDKPALFTPSLQQTDSLVSLQLHWHQLAGVHSIICNTFTATSSPGHCTGILECDEVGLGKTALAIAVIGFLNQAVALQEAKKPLPPILQSFPYLQDTKIVPALPHLIIMPGTLRSQWLQELKTLFLPKSIDIFQYDCPKSGNPGFWDPTGPFHSSKHQLQNRIILVTHSVVSSEQLFPTQTRADQAGSNCDASSYITQGIFALFSMTRVEIDDDGLSIQKAQIIAVRRIQKQFFGHVLRRTANSLNWEKKTLLTIPLYKDIIGVLSLTDRETEILTQRADDAKANVISGNNTGKFQTKKFYLEYWLCVAYAKSDPNSPNPNFKSLAEWKNIKSTKMDICAKICAYYLNRDDVPDVTFTDGKLIFPKISKLDPALSHLKTPIDGTMSFDKQTETVAEFYKPDSARVLIFSSVGSAGLNLSIADVVIFFDQSWSSQDEIQIQGRAHRQPQKKEVKAIHLLAENSTDILINNLARGKKDMYDAFVHKNLAKELAGLLSGDIVDAGPEDGEAIQDPINPPEKPKKRKMSRKGKGKEKVPEETAQAPEKENKDGEMDIVQNSLLENQSQPDPQAFESAPTTDIDGMDIAEDPHAFQSTDAEGMGITEEEGELGFPMDEASLSGAQEKSVDTLERKSDNGASHTPDSPQSAKSPPPKRRKTDSQTADSQMKPKVGPLVNLKKTAKPKSSHSDKPQPENRGRPVTKKSQAAPASTSRSSAGPSSTSRASTSQRPISLNQFSTRLESQSIEDEEDVPPPRHSTIPYERRQKDGSKG